MEEHSCWSTTPPAVSGIIAKLEIQEYLRKAKVIPINEIVVSPLGGGGKAEKVRSETMTYLPDPSQKSIKEPFISDLSTLWMLGGHRVLLDQ